MKVGEVGGRRQPCCGSRKRVLGSRGRRSKVTRRPLSPLGRRHRCLAVGKSRAHLPGSTPVGVARDDRAEQDKLGSSQVGQASPDPDACGTMLADRVPCHLVLYALYLDFTAPQPASTSFYVRNVVTLVPAFWTLFSCMSEGLRNKLSGHFLWSFLPRCHFPSSVLTFSYLLSLSHTCNSWAVSSESTRTLHYGLVLIFLIRFFVKGKCL